VRIEVKDGFVSLTGKIDDEDKKSSLKTLVDQYAGVNDVAMLLEVIKH
jgi:osmotically-inducible protein OsmY